MSEIFVGDVGVQIELGTGQDLSSATLMEIHVQPPDGPLKTWAATPVAEPDPSDLPPGQFYGKISYTTISGDFSVAGDYLLQAYVEWGELSKHLGETVTLRVYEEYSVSGIYATVSDAETYFEGDTDPSTIAFLALPASQKSFYLRRATANIDSHNFQGFKYLSTQDLEFPRKFKVSDTESPWGLTPTIDMYGYYTETEVPQAIKDATCLEALELYKGIVVGSGGSGGLNEQALQDAGIRSFSLGRLSMSFGGKAAFGSNYMVSKKAYKLIEKYIEYSKFLI